MIDENGQTISKTSEKINFLNLTSLEKNIFLPVLTPKGNYRILVSTYDGKNLISGEDFFQVKEMPLINVGATTFSLSQLMRGLSWISILLALLFLILLSIEHYQSKEALFHITEKYLRRRGFFTRRREVLR